MKIELNFESAEEMRKWEEKHYGNQFDLLLCGYAHFFARVPAETE